jgi:hypothetical protein
MEPFSRLIYVYLSVIETCQIGSLNCSFKCFDSGKVGCIMPKPIGTPLATFEY